MDIRVEEAMAASETRVIGRVRGRKFSADYIRRWVLSEWEHAPGQPVKIKVLERGWFTMLFAHKANVNWVLDRNWSFGKRPLFLQRWTPLFDAQTEKLNESPVWVKLPGLPLQFWFDSVFKSIGDTLGKFLDFDRSFEQSDDMSVARILVRLNPREGLAEAMTLRYRELEFVQKLDYENLPFRCHRCHAYGHLAKECPLGYRRRRNPIKMARKSAFAPVSNSGSDPSYEPMEEEAKDGSEEVMSEAPSQQLTPARSVEQPFVRTAPQIPSTAGIAVEPLEQLQAQKASQANSTVGFVAEPQTGMPIFLPSSLCSSYMENVSASMLSGSSGCLQKEFSCLNLNPQLIDSLVVTVPLPSGDPLASLSASCHSCSNLDPAPPPTAPPYNLRSLSLRIGKETAPGGLEQDIVPIGPRKSRGRKSNLSKAKQKAIIDIVDGKQKSLTGVLRAAKPPSVSLK